MKIRITESQYNKIRLVKENEDFLNKFKSFCAAKISEIDSIYSKILYETVADVLNFNMNFKEINNRISKIDDDVYKAEKNVIAMYQRGTTHIEEIELTISDIAEAVSDKATSLTLILNKLEELQDYQEEHRLTKQFSNVKPMEI